MFNLLANLVLRFVDELTGYHSGQHDCILWAYVGDERVGYVKYSVYNDRPAVHYINTAANWRRKGIAKQLLLQLQSKYPHQEIELGMLTDDGAALADSLKYREEPTEWKPLFDKLDRLRLEHQKKKAELQHLLDIESDSPDKEAWRKQIYQIGDKENTLDHEIWTLEGELRYRQPTVKIIVG